MTAYLNRIATAVPPHDVHAKFLTYVPSMLDERQCALFQRMAARAQIDHRHSFLQPTSHHDRLDEGGFYRRGNFPSTKTRMQFYEDHAFLLAQKALDALDLPAIATEVTHLIITSCTGFYAPGLDLQIVAHYGLRPSTERSIIGFMGCYAAINALKLARHIVRSERTAKVAILNIELCTIHLQETPEMEEILSFLIFADGCAASIVSAEAVGIELQSFHCAALPDSSGLITWHIGDQGFDMYLSGQVPHTLVDGLKPLFHDILHGVAPRAIRHWAVHPGGRTILDAVKEAALLPEEALLPSREILRRYGNMSSATIMFVLKEMLEARQPGLGCAMAFGPGLTTETMRFAIPE